MKKNEALLDLFFLSFSLEEMPTKIYIDWNHRYDESPIKSPLHNPELYIVEPIERKSSRAWRQDIRLVLSVPMNNEPSPTKSDQRVPLGQTPMDFDQSTSSANRSIHLPVEKQRGISEIIRKRNSRFKVEDYKRSFQRSSTFDESPSEISRPISSSKSDQVLTKTFPSTSNAASPKTTRRLTKTKSFDIPIEIENEENRRKEKSMEKLNDLIQNAGEEKPSVAAKRNMFETISRDVPSGPTLTRSKSFKQET